MPLQIIRNDITKMRVGGLVELGNIDQLIVLMKDAFQETFHIMDRKEISSWGHGFIRKNWLNK